MAMAFAGMGMDDPRNTQHRKPKKELTEFEKRAKFAEIQTAKGLTQYDFYEDNKVVSIFALNRKNAQRKLKQLKQHATNPPGQETPTR